MTLTIGCLCVCVCVVLTFVSRVLKNDIKVLKIVAKIVKNCNIVSGELKWACG